MTHEGLNEEAVVQPESGLEKLEEEVATLKKENRLLKEELAARRSSLDGFRVGVDQARNGVDVDFSELLDEAERSIHERLLLIKEREAELG